MSHLLNGVYVAALTPLRSDFSVNVEELVRHCKDLINRGCTGVALFGTTGEGPSMSHQERETLLRQVTSLGIDPTKAIVANGASGIKESVSLGKLAVSLGYDVLLISPPTFFKNVSDEGVIAYYRAVITGISSEKIKVILYHIPQFTGVPITHAVVKTLLQEFPNTVVGIKESEGNISYSKLLVEQHPNFKVFVGNEKQIIEAVRFGGAGSICGIANLYPELICSLYKIGKEPVGTNPEKLLSFFESMGKLNFVAAFKSIMEKRFGESWATLLPPLTPLTEQERVKFLSAIVSSGIEDK